MRTAVSLIIVAFLAACGGLPSAGQFQAEGTKIGLSAGTDPAAGGFDATLGYKHARMTYNPNAKEGGGDKPDQILSATYGNATDSRSIVTWKNAKADSGQGAGVAISLGDGAAMGPAAAIMACGMGNAAANTSLDCLAMFTAPPG